ncbi:Proteasome subunit alpha type-1, partial [Galemys pyrenaicus]
RSCTEHTEARNLYIFSVKGVKGKHRLEPCFATSITVTAVFGGLRSHEIEYAMKTIKPGSVTVLKSKTNTVLVALMRACILHCGFVFDKNIFVSHLVSLIGSKIQITVQQYGQRPYGFRLLSAGCEDKGPQHFPNVCLRFDYRPVFIRSCSQSVPTWRDVSVYGVQVECTN